MQVHNQGEMKRCNSSILHFKWRSEVSLGLELIRLVRPWDSTGQSPLLWQWVRSAAWEWLSSGKNGKPAPRSPVTFTYRWPTRGSLRMATASGGRRTKSNLNLARRAELECDGRLTTNPLTAELLGKKVNRVQQIHGNCEERRGDDPKSGARIEFEQGGFRSRNGSETIGRAGPDGGCECPVQRPRLRSLWPRPTGNGS